MHLHRSAPRCLFLCAALMLAGCGSIAKGVTEAVMEQRKEDTRLCNINGPEFPGIEESIVRQSAAPHTTKVLMVHGIGSHLPDYSARFREKLTRELWLDRVEEDTKEIVLSGTFNNPNGKENIGILKIWRYLSSAASREMLFYELTWSGITAPDKEVIAYDDSEAYTYRRAGINGSLKEFMNHTLPDLMVYEGMKQPLINAAVGQSVCWMFTTAWRDLPSAGRHHCDITNAAITMHVPQEDYFVVTHSLGSRIAIDTFNNYATIAQTSCAGCEKFRALNSIMKNKELTIFMLANQLPFLQIGKPPSGYAGMRDAYCLPGGSRYASRLVGKMRIVAFSDPNDILSYPIPPDYPDHYIDSRICPEVINIDINVAPVVSVLGAADLANPLEAHSGYQEDDRVVKIIAHGLHRGAMDPMVADRCRWTETVKENTAMRR